LTHNLDLLTRFHTIIDIIHKGITVLDHPVAWTSVAAVANTPSHLCGSRRGSLRF